MRELNARTDNAGARWSIEGLRDLITVQLARMTDHPAWTTLRQSLRPPNAIAFNAIAFNAIAFNAIAFNAIAFNAIAFNAIAFNAIAFNITTAEFPAGLRRIRHRRLLPPDRGPAAVAQLRTDPGRDGTPWPDPRPRREHRQAARIGPRPKAAGTAVPSWLPRRTGSTPVGSGWLGRRR
jgi:hypothetical protein